MSRRHTETLARNLGCNILFSIENDFKTAYRNIHKELMSIVSVATHIHAPEKNEMPENNIMHFIVTFSMCILIPSHSSEEKIKF